MRRTGEQRDPILVDEKTHVAMDGMHRIESLRSLGAKFAVCAEYDLHRDDIQLERWLRTIIAPSTKLIEVIISKFEMKPCKSIQHAIGLVQTKEAGLALLSRRHSYFGGENLDIEDVYTKVAEIDALCEKNKIELQFAGEHEKLRMFSSDSVYMLFPAHLSKSDVLRLAMANRLLPYKTTRYVVPIRPMGLYYPISFLSVRTLSECNHELERIVNLSKVVVKRKDSWYEGRKYSERVAIFRKSD
jgi:hypothetical protein